MDGQGKNYWTACILGEGPRASGSAAGVGGEGGLGPALRLPRPARPPAAVSKVNAVCSKSIYRLDYANYVTNLCQISSVFQRS